MPYRNSIPAPADSLAPQAATPDSLALPADSLPRYLLRPDEVAETAEWPGLHPQSADSLFAVKTAEAQPDTVELPLFRIERLPATEMPGFTGDLLPYSFRTDNYITGALLLSFFLAAWVLATLRHYLRECLKDMLHHPAHAEALDERTGNERRAQWLMTCITCFLLSILYYDFIQHRSPGLLDDTSPYTVLGIGAGACFLYYAFKGLLYQAVNRTLFGRRQAQMWSETFQLSLLVQGLALIPLTLLVVYFDLSYENMLLGFAALIVAVKIPLLFRCFSIFFQGALGCVHLILYFCALEIAPALVLWRVLLRAAFYLTSNP